MNTTQQVKAIMKARGISQEQVAIESGMHPVTLSRLLKNLKKPETAYDKLVLFIEKNKHDLPAPQN